MSVRNAYHRWLVNDPDIVSRGWTWDEVYYWDRLHLNADEVAERDVNLEALNQAYATFQTDRHAGFQMSLNLARQSSVWSMHQVGRCYEYGRGVAQDAGKAECWYQRASAGGLQIAMLDCARSAASRGDYPSCNEILQSGVDKDWAPAFFWLAWHYHKQSHSRESYRHIRTLLEHAAERGHPGADFMLIHFMVNGRFGRHLIPQGFMRAIGSAIRRTRLNVKLQASS